MGSAGAEAHGLQSSVWRVHGSSAEWGCDVPEEAGRECDGFRPQIRGGPHRSTDEIRSGKARTPGALAEILSALREFPLFGRGSAASRRQWRGKQPPIPSGQYWIHSNQLKTSKLPVRHRSNWSDSRAWSDAVRFLSPFLDPKPQQHDSAHMIRGTVFDNICCRQLLHHKCCTIGRTIDRTPHMTVRNTQELVESLFSYSEQLRRRESRQRPRQAGLQSSLSMVNLRDQVKISPSIERHFRVYNCMESRHSSGTGPVGD